MAFDGLVISNLIDECRHFLTDGRIYKIYQPEPDELILVIKCQKESVRETSRLLLSANASLPLFYITTEATDNPLSAPNFCMLLRKHIQNGRIVSFEQPGFERIVDISIEHRNEMGDLCTKHLIVELMGKHSNIIFCDSEYRIIDSIKHISAQISSVREVLPGRDYLFPPSGGKQSPLEITERDFEDSVCAKPLPTAKAVYTSITGISPLIAEELCFRAGVDSSRAIQSLDGEARGALWQQIRRLALAVENRDYLPLIVYDGRTPLEFSSMRLTMYARYKTAEYPTISEVLQTYYAEKNSQARIRQKSADLRRIVSTALERTSKKYDLQLQQLKNTEKRDIYKIYGELINTYGYGLEPDANALTCLNYYTGEEITIPLDPSMTPSDNAKKYFTRYNKLKRTYEALTGLTKETQAELFHLESVGNALDIAVSERDLSAIREELVQCGYIRRRRGEQKKQKTVSRPFHYISSDGYDIYVGKNNLQNDELTFQFANGKDWWFHAKGMAGSHVIVKTGQDQLPPDRTFEEAGRLAAYYSKGRTSPRVEVDYTERKNLKKPPAAKPGFVIYHTNYSLLIEPDISGIRQAE